MYLVGVAGGSGSGKTTFAQKVMNYLDTEKVSILSMDSYYLSRQPDDKRTKSGKANFDHPDAFDWPLLKEDLLILKSENAVDTPIYDFAISRRTSGTKRIGPSQVVILEGIFTLFDLGIRDLLDVKCFLHVDSDIRFTRRLHRDVKERERSLESVIEQYYETVRPMHQKYLEPQKQYADFTIGEETDIAAKILSDHIIKYMGVES